MSVSLYDLSVASYLQTLTAISGCLEKGLAHCTAQGTDPEALVQARLASLQNQVQLYRALGGGWVDAGR